MVAEDAVTDEEDGRVWPLGTQHIEEWPEALMD